MINLIKKINDEKNTLKKIFCLVILFFGINMFLNFATDTYAVFKDGFGTSAKDMFFRNGRAIIALIYELHYLSGFSNETFYYISSILAIFFLGLTIWLMQKLLKEYNITENRGILLSFISIANIFIIEYFMFIEKCGFMLAILFNVLGTYCMSNFYRNKGQKYFYFAILSICLAIFTYQGTIALFVLLTLPFAYKNSDGFKNYILRIIEIGIVYGIAISLDMLAFKFLFKSIRFIEKQNYIMNLKSVIKNLTYIKTIIDSILPNHLFEIVLLVMLLIDVILVGINKNKIMRLISIIILLISAFIFPMATIIQGSGWSSMRVIYPMASIIGVLIIDIYLNNQMNTNNINYFKIIDKFIMITIMILLANQYLSFNKIYIDKYRLNISDENRANYIGEAIIDYQNSTGNEITKIAFYKDESMATPSYPNLYCIGDLVISSFNAEWSDIDALNYYLGTNFEKIEQENKYIDYFSSKNWDRLSQEQLIFEGNTLHICVY